MNINKTNSITYSFIVMAAIIIVLAGIKAAASILVPLLLSVFIAIICNPILKLGDKFHLPQWASISLIITAIILFGMGLASIIGSSISDFSNQMPTYKVKLETQFGGVIGQLATFNIHINSDFLKEHFDPSIVMGMVSNLLAGFGGAMANTFLILLTVIFMLSESKSFPKKIHYAMNDPEGKLSKIDDFISSVNNYIAIKTVISLITGILAGTLCWAVGVNHFILWGLLAFLLNYLPNVGSILSAIPAVLMALIEVGAPGAAIVGIGYVAINAIMGNIIEPKYMGKGLGLSTLVVFLSLAFWGWLLGMAGMLLSIPLTMIVKIALEKNESSGWFAAMLASPEEIETKHKG